MRGRELASRLNKGPKCEEYRSICGAFLQLFTYMQQSHYVLVTDEAIGNITRC